MLTSTFGKWLGGRCSLFAARRTVLISAGQDKASVGGGVPGVAEAEGVTVGDEFIPAGDTKRMAAWQASEGRSTRSGKRR